MIGSCWWPCYQETANGCRDFWVGMMSSLLASIWLTTLLILSVLIRLKLSLKLTRLVGVKIGSDMQLKSITSGLSPPGPRSLLLVLPRLLWLISAVSRPDMPRSIRCICGSSKRMFSFVCCHFSRVFEVFQNSEIFFEIFRISWNILYSVYL